MWNIVPSSEKCKFKIIEQLFSEKTPVTVQKLSQITNTSPRSVRSYISELKIFIKSLGGEINTSSDGVSLKSPSNIGIDYFQRNVFKNTDAFHLLEKLFFEESVTKKEMEDYLFISPSTMNRMLKNLNICLKQYGISINMNPLFLTGEEMVIRTFYISYFQEAYSVTEWPFPNIEMDLVDALGNQFYKHYQFKGTSLNYIEYRTNSAVCMTRALNNHLLEDEVKYNGEDAEWLKEILCAFNFKNESLEHCYSVLFTIHNNLLETFSYGKANSEAEPDNEMNEMIILINQLAEEYNIPDDIRPTNLDISHINFKLSYYNKLYALGVNETHLLFKPREYYFYRVYQTHYPQFYNSLYQKLVILLEDRGFTLNQYMMNGIISLFLAKWNNLTKSLFYQYVPCNLLVYSHSSDIIALNFAEELKSRLSRFINIEIITGRKISEEKLRNYHFDILVTTTTLQLNINQPIIYLYRSPDFVLDLSGLENTIDTLVQKKRVQHFNAQ